MLLLNLDSPLSLDTLGLLSVRACLRFDLGNSEGKHAQGQQLECVLERSSVGDFGEKRVLLAGLFVGGGLKGAQSTLDCAGLAL